MTRREILEYEIRTSSLSWLFGLAVLPVWVHKVLGRYYAWKTERMFERYHRYK